MPSSSKPEPAKGSLKTLLGLFPFLKPYGRQFLLAGLALIVAATATLAIPYAFKQMIDLGFGANGIGGGKSTLHIDLYFLALFGVACILGVATAARFYMVSWLGERVTADLRSAVYAHVVTQSPQFLETTKTGEVLSRLTTDTTLIQTLVGTSISMALRNGLLFLGGMVMLFITASNCRPSSSSCWPQWYCRLFFTAAACASCRANRKTAWPTPRRWPAKSSTPCRPCRHSRMKR